MTASASLPASGGAEGDQGQTPYNLRILRDFASPRGTKRGSARMAGAADTGPERSEG